VGTTLTEIFNQLKELEKKFNEVKYFSEAAFQPSFSSIIRKAEKNSLIQRLPAFELDELFEKIEE